MNPDVMLILTLDHQTRAERIAMRGELENPDTFESRANDFQDRVNQGYLEIAKKYDILTIDAAGSPGEIQAKIRQAVDV